MKNTIGTLILGLFGLTLTACNTVSGVGEDVQSAGETIEDLAEDTREELND